jgi:hypothetical protein
MPQETEEQRHERRARAIQSVLEPDRSWAALSKAERDRLRRAAHRVAASDAEAGVMPIPVDGPFSTRERTATPPLSGLRAHVPSVAAFYAEAGASPDGQGAPEDLGPEPRRDNLRVVVRTLLAVGAFTAAAAGLLTLGLHLGGP